MKFLEGWDRWLWLGPQSEFKKKFISTERLFSADIWITEIIAGQNRQ